MLDSFREVFCAISGEKIHISLHLFFLFFYYIHVFKNAFREYKLFR